MNQQFVRCVIDGGILVLEGAILALQGLNRRIEGAKFGGNGFDVLLVFLLLINERIDFLIVGESIIVEEKNG